jgi:hypothetical protein
MKRATPKEVVPTQPGTTFAGGIYMGRYFEGTEARALILAPREGGEIEADHAGAMKQAKACRIGDHKDWQLPTRLQVLTLWIHRKALGTDEALPDEWHWTSEKYERAAGFAWYQSFDGGGQDGDLRGNPLRVRFVRSVVI